MSRQFDEQGNFTTPPIEHAHLRAEKLATRDLVAEARALMRETPGYTSRGPTWELRRARNLLTELADEIESLRTERDQHAETARQALATATHQAGQLSAIRSAREITDPDELPPGSIVVRDGVAWQLEKGWWSMRGTRTRWDKPHGTGPIILLYVPTEEAEPVVGATLRCGQCGATATAPASPDGRTVPIAPLTGWQLIPDQHVVRCPGCVPAEEATGE